MPLPIIDISAFRAGDEEECAKAWDTAFSTQGACIVIGHGITNSLVNVMLQESSDWFSKTEQDVKNTFNHGPYGNPKGGYSGIGLEAVAASMDGASAKGKVDPVESFVFMGKPSDHIDPSGNKLDSKSFPHADEYLQRVTDLRQKLHRVACVALGIEDKAYFEPLYSDPEHADAFRLAFYPPEEQHNGSGVRYGAHTDYEDMTILKPDYNDWTQLPQSAMVDATPDDGKVYTTGGLQVLSRSHENDRDNDAMWEAVVIAHDEGDPEADVPFIVNIGDYWNAWTANRWRSPVHRVTKSGYQLDQSLAKPCVSTNIQLPRQALVYFATPRHDTMISPLKGTNIDNFQSAESTENPYHPSNYEPVNAYDHLQMKILRSNV
jgi:isopenicillin N synthase-like dioxygenase